MTWEELSVEQMGRVRHHKDSSVNGLIIILTKVDRTEILAKVMQPRGMWKVGDELSLVPDNFDPNIL